MINDCASATEKGVYWYMYCLNNPLKYTDPTGQRFVDDIWDFDENGNFLQRIKTNEFDQIRIWDNARENIITQTEKFAYKTIKQHRPSGYSEGEIRTLDIFRVQGDDNAQQIFEFFHNNTTVEWDRTQIGREGSEKNMIGTSHRENSVSVGAYLLKNDYNIRSHTHNHHYEPIPSGIETFRKTGVRTMDLRGAELMQAKFPNVQLNLYTTKYGYSPYNMYGTLDPRFGYLPPVIVKP